jgi:hypothetical protein
VRALPSLLLPLMMLCVSACSRSEPDKAAAPAGPAPSAQATAKSAEPPKPTIEDTTFKLALTGQPEYAAGKQASVQLILEARGGYHVNQEYPIRVDLKSATGLKLAKGSLERADAVQFGEQSARFELPFSAEPGVHDLTASVDFAVCTKETCVPDQRTLALAVTVR